MSKNNEQRVETGIYVNASGSYSAKVPDGWSRGHTTLESARGARVAAYGPDGPTIGRNKRYLEGNQMSSFIIPRQGEPHAVAAYPPSENGGEPERVGPELSEAVMAHTAPLRARLEQIKPERDELRARLQELDDEAQRFQAAIDALEGNEKDASAEFRRPGSRPGLSDDQRRAFQPALGRPPGAPSKTMMRHKEGERLVTIIVECLPIGEDNAIGRQELTARVQKQIDYQTNPDQVSRYLHKAIKRGQAYVNQPNNPRDYCYWR